MQSQPLETNAPGGRTVDTTSSVLLVDPDPDPDLRDSRRLLLTSRHISVLAISSYAEVYQLPELGCYNLIVLSIRPNEIKACHVAEYARRRWPKARLLLLGDSCGSLDDPLYDEIVNPSGNPSGFIEAAERLLESVRTGRIVPIVPWR